MSDIHRIKVLPPASFNGIEFPQGDVETARVVLEDASVQCPRLAKYYGPTSGCASSSNVKPTVDHIEVSIGPVVNSHE
jgi:hypothetical protein